jgi:hypothetical protein
MGMPDAPKLFTIEEATALIPKLEALFGQLQVRYLQMKRIVEPLEKEGLTQQEIERRLQDHPELRTHLAEIEHLVKSIQETGAQFKGIEMGLVDFPFLHEGKVRLLCWQFGEKEIRWWHDVESGFAGRRPLPGAKTKVELN